jgi:methyl-accepting chemotaxis protein
MITILWIGLLMMAFGAWQSRDAMIRERAQLTTLVDEAAASRTTTTASQRNAMPEAEAQNRRSP